MFTRLDALTIDEVVSPAFGRVIYEGLASIPEKRRAIREFIRLIATSTEPGDLIARLRAHRRWPESVKQALTDIVAYLYSANPQGDFFNRPANFATEIQPYLRNMLHSIVYYLDDDVNANAPEGSKDIDQPIKKILRPDLFKNKRELPFQKTIQQSHDALNEVTNITVYKELQEPVEKLKKLKEEFAFKANDPARLRLDQRLHLLENIGHFEYVGRQLRQRQQVPLPPQPRALNPDDNAARNCCLIPVSIISGLMGMSILYVIYLMYAKEQRHAIASYGWPAGLTDMQNSTANLPNWVGKGFYFSDFNNLAIPFYNINQRKHPELEKIKNTINSARSSADHEYVDVGLNQAMEKIDRLLINQNAMLSECYIYLWSFLSEHGLESLRLASKGISVHLQPSEQLQMRSLEALRAGLEELFKYHHPEIAQDLSCKNAWSYEKQLDALEAWVTAERSLPAGNHYTDRLHILGDWHHLLDEYNVGKPRLTAKEIREINEIKMLKAPIGSEPEYVMRSVMYDTDCPWWQAPFNYMRNTAHGVNKMVCDAWKRTAVPSTANMKPIEDNSYYSYIKSKLF